MTEHVPGPTETTTMEGIDRAGNLDVGMRSSLREMARKLARAFDECQTDDITAIAKLSAELRQVNGKLMDAGNTDTESVAAQLARMSTPRRCPNCGHTS